MTAVSRTYRPTTFKDITGQTPITETLRREVATGKLAHAFIFGGPRGVGKTTSARVFAKALICEDVHEGEPCNACAACLEANEGRALDIIEMDAASHTGVDHVREAIVDHVRYAPVARKRKVYILDEAHMLSTSSWNALLKTLEEPPVYAFFILITTELHKVPATILSRCQRFDFKRILPEPMAERLKTLAEQEKVALDPDVLQLIVTKSEGCLRDAESLFGQLLTLGESRITMQSASLVLPISRLPIAAQVLSQWSKRELSPAMRQLGDLEDQGIALLPLVDDMLFAIRRLLLAAETKEEQDRLKNGDEGERALANLVGSFVPAELSEIALMLMERRRDAKGGVDIRFCLELGAASVVLGMLPHGSASGSAGLAIRSTPTPYSPPERVTPPKAEVPLVRLDPVPKLDPAPASNPPPPISVPTPLSSVPLSSVVSSYSLDDALIAWPTFMKWVSEKSPSVSFVLRVTKPGRVENGVLFLQFQYPFHKEKVLSELKTRRMVEDGLSIAMQKEVHIDGYLQTAPDEDASGGGMVDAVLKAFGGEVVESSPPASTS